MTSLHRVQHWDLLRDSQSKQPDSTPLPQYDSSVFEERDRKRENKRERARERERERPWAAYVCTWVKLFTIRL